MKILHALYSDRNGGLEKAFINNTKMLMLLGYKVELWVPKNAQYINEFKLTCQSVDLTCRGYLDFLSIIRFHLQLKKSAPDLIVTHNSRATSILNQARTRLNIPQLAFSHGYKFRRFKKTDHLVTLTTDMKQHFACNGWATENISIFPNVIESIPSLSSYTKHKTDQPIRLGFIGRLTNEKGLEDLLQAISMLKDSYNVELDIAGSGPDQLLVEALIEQLNIQPNIHFSGWVDDIANWMKSLDLVIIPSRSESFGIVVLEAAAYGCPVIATNVSGPASQIRHGVDGWLAKPESPEHLAEVISQVLEQQDAWESVRYAAYQRAHNYLMSSRLEQLQNIIESVVYKKS